MGKRRSQSRQNAAFQRITAPEAQSQPPSPRLLRPVGGSRPFSAAAEAPSGDVFERARRRFGEQIEWLEDNPLALTLGGLAVGVLAGLVLPASEDETERLGSAGENIASQVQEHVQAIGQDVVEHGKAVIVETMQASILEGKSPVDAVQQSVQEHLVTVAQNAQARVEASLGQSSSEA